MCINFICFSKIMEFFLKWSRTFIEFNDFSEFRESDKSLKQKLGSILRSYLSHVSLTQDVVDLNLFADK